MFPNTLVFIYLPREFWDGSNLKYSIMLLHHMLGQCVFILCFRKKSHCRSLPTMLKILSRKRTIYGNRREMSRSSQLAPCLGLACKSGFSVLSNTSQNLLKPYLKLDSNSIWSHQWYKYRQHCVGESNARDWQDQQIKRRQLSFHKQLTWCWNNTLPCRQQCSKK